MLNQLRKKYSKTHGHTGFGKTLNRPAKANQVQCYQHVLRRDSNDKLIALSFGEAGRRKREKSRGRGAARLKRFVKKIKLEKG